MKRSMPPALAAFLTWHALSLSPAFADRITPDPQPAGCTQLVSKGVWETERVSAFFIAGIPSLQITLNEPACVITPAHIDVLFDEIFATYSTAPDWDSRVMSQAQVKESMKSQLLCQLLSNPVPTPLTLEPRRYATSLQAYQDMKCNPPPPPSTFPKAPGA